MAREFTWAERVLTYFVQRQVVKVTRLASGFRAAFDHGHVDVLDGGVPMIAGGMALAQVVANDDGTTTITFASNMSGSVDVVTGDYVVEHPRAGTVTSSDVPEDPVLPPDPSSERVVDGPEDTGS